MSKAGNLFIGLMSGTSLDAIDAALIRVNESNISLLATLSHPINSSLRDSIVALCQPGGDEINRAGRLHLTLGETFAEAVQTLLHQESIAPKQITAIGSHGQTVRHRPHLGFSLQLGSADVIATQTGITTVCDFRNHDMVLGGQGAPLAPTFHQAVLGKPGEKRAIINIGGMANVSLLDGNDLLAGFDTGPGNVLLNDWCHQHTVATYDDQGQYAATGTILPGLLKQLLADDFFRQKGPKSTGRERFNVNWLSKHLTGKERPEDVQATLTELTAVSIANALADFSPDGAYVCGGGAHNTFLLTRLASQLSSATTGITDTLGWPADWVEAACFAWLAWARLNQVPATSPAVTGAHRAAISGAVYLP